MKEPLDEGYTLGASGEKVRNRIKMIEEMLNKLKARPYPFGVLVLAEWIKGKMLSAFSKSAINCS